MNNRVKRLILFAQAVAGDIKALKLKIGNTDTLVTDDKTSTVNAINEVAGSSKEIKDSIEKFKTEIGINSEIAKANNISVNPFELLIPFIKNQISHGQTSDSEYNETVYYIPSQPHVIKSILNDKLSSNVGFKIKQGTFEKFVHFASPVEDNFELPTEIDTSKEYTINEYDIFGHYLNTYKVVPYVDFVNSNISKIILSNIGYCINYTTQEKINTVFTEDDKDIPNNYFILYINENASKYYNPQTKQWENMPVNLPKQYEDSLFKVIQKSDFNKIQTQNINLTNSFSFNSRIDTYIADETTKMSIENISEKKRYFIYNENNANKKIILNNTRTKYYNFVSSEWKELPKNISDSFINASTEVYSNLINNFDTTKLINYSLGTIKDESFNEPIIPTNFEKLALYNSGNKYYIIKKDTLKNSVLGYRYNNNANNLILDDTLSYYINKDTKQWTELTSAQKNSVQNKIKEYELNYINDENTLVKFYPNILYKDVNRGLDGAIEFTNSDGIGGSFNRNLKEIQIVNNKEDVNKIDFKYYYLNALVFTKDLNEYFDTLYTFTWKQTPDDVKQTVLNKIYNRYNDFFNTNITSKNINYCTQLIDVKTENCINVIEESMLTEWMEKEKPVSISTFIINVEGTKYFDYMTSNGWTPLKSQQQANLEFSDLHLDTTSFRNIFNKVKSKKEKLLTVLQNMDISKTFTMPNTPNAVLQNSDLEGKEIFRDHGCMEDRWSQFLQVPNMKNMKIISANSNYNGTNITKQDILTYLPNAELISINSNQTDLSNENELFDKYLFVTLENNIVYLKISKDLTIQIKDKNDPIFKLAKEKLEVAPSIMTRSLSHL